MTGDEGLQSGERVLCLDFDPERGLRVAALAGALVSVDLTGTWEVCMRDRSLRTDTTRDPSCAFCEGERDHVRYAPEDLFRSQSEAEVKVGALNMQVEREFGKEGEE